MQMPLGCGLTAEKWNGIASPAQTGNRHWKTCAFGTLMSRSILGCSTTVLLAEKSSFPGPIDQMITCIPLGCQAELDYQSHYRRDFTLGARLFSFRSPIQALTPKF
jgi:hypothetical protein